MHGNNENSGTILKPYGNVDIGLDMFYYNDYADSNFEIGSYLTNANFKDFIIDGYDARGKKYNSSGKGFMINLLKNCNWENITVKNTDGTGFGMDCPINCTIKNCKAISCGKNGKINDYGASGFGIGTGYSNDEYIYISNCEAIDNKKYGFFFEHQGIFSNGQNYSASSSDGFVVIDCNASGNLYDFGGNKAYDVTYVNCNSIYKKPNLNAIYFEGKSVRCNFITDKMMRENNFKDVQNSSDYYYTPVYWAYSQGITNGDSNTTFSPYSNCLRRDAVTLIYRIAGMPGDVSYNSTANTVFDDVPDDAYYTDAVKWGVENGIVAIDKYFNPNRNVSRAEFVTFLWRYAGKPEAKTRNNFEDVEKGSYYEKAVNWAVSQGITYGTSNSSFSPNKNCTRAEVITFLYRYMNSKNTFKITYNLQGGTINGENPSTYKSGENKITLKNPTKEGYTFKGWIENKNENNKSVVEENVTISKNDVGNKVYTAIWSPNTYTIVFDSNGGNGKMTEQYFKYDVAQTLEINQFSKVGKVFDSWNTKKDGTGTKFSNAQAVTNLKSNNDKITLYAQWKNVSSENRTNIFIGDSIFVEMHNIIGDNGDIYSAKRGEGINWLKEEGLPKVESKIGDNTNIIIGMGINDLFNKCLNNGNVDVDGVINKYERYFNAKIIEWTQKGANVYFTSIGPFDQSKIDSSTRKVNNTDAIDFNNKIQSQLKGMTYIDIYSNILNDMNEKNIDLTRNDGTHYVSLAYVKRYKIIKDNLNQSYTPVYTAFENMSDIEENDWYIEPLKWCYQNAYIEPISNTRFGPNNNISIVEAIELIWRSQGIPYSYKNLTYSDVSESDLYYDAIMWSVSNKIYEGKSSSNFGINNNCTRAEFITFLWNLAGNPKSSKNNSFTDVGNNKTYTKAINWALENGIISNSSNNTFRPNDTCLRKEAVTFIYRYCNK